MHKARLILANDFCQMREKGNHVMFGHRFDFINPRDVELCVFGLPYGGGVLFGDDAEFGLGIARMRFDFVPNAEFRFWRPNGNHFRTGIA